MLKIVAPVKKYFISLSEGCDLTTGFFIFMKLREYLLKIDADSNFGERDKYLYLLGSILSDKYLYKFGKRPDKTPEIINGETILSNDYPDEFIEKYFLYAIEDLLEFINNENPSDPADELPF